MSDNINQVTEETVEEVVSEDVVASDDSDAKTSAPMGPEPKTKFGQKLDAYFGIRENGSSFRTEIIGGVTTFFAMCYIMFVNPSTMTGTDASSHLWQAVFVATALGAIIGTLLIALYAKMPFAQAPGMGLNAFFFVSFMLPVVLGTSSLTQDNAFYYGLSIIFLSGIIFLLLSVTGVRKKIALSMPASLKKAIPAGIGLFIAFIAFQNVGLIEYNEFTLVQLMDFNSIIEGAGAAGWYAIAPALIAFFGLLIIGILSKNKKIGKFSVIITILICTVLYYLFNIGNDAAFAVFKGGVLSPKDTFTSFGKHGIGRVFVGFKYWSSATVLSAIMAVITFCLVDMFDTLGTLQGTCAESGQLDEEGNPQNLSKCLQSDAIATVAGSVFGTSTVTTYVESAAGVSAGARTGLSSVVVAGLFFIAMFLTPLAQIIPGSATAPALMYVGVLMLRGIKEVDFADMKSAIPAFLTVIMMPLTYSISNGIAIGMIAHTILTLASIRSKEDIKDFFTKDIIVAVIAVLFTLRFFLVSM